MYIYFCFFIVQIFTYMRSATLLSPPLASLPLPGSCLLRQVYPNLASSVAAACCHGFAQIWQNLWLLSAAIDLSKSG